MTRRPTRSFVERLQEVPLGPSGPFRATEAMGLRPRKPLGIDVRTERLPEDTAAVKLASDGSLLMSPSDLAAHLSCPHLTQLAGQVQRGEIPPPPPRKNPHADLISRKGDEHEAAHRAIDALAETVWEAQRDRSPPSNERYLERLRRAAG